MLMLMLMLITADAVRYMVCSPKNNPKGPLCNTKTASKNQDALGARSSRTAELSLDKTLSHLGSHPLHTPSKKNNATAPGTQQDP